MDEMYMRRALRLARRGEGYVEPNPMVGAVLVCRGRMLGEGWHRRFGGPHAEIEALRRGGVGWDESARFSRNRAGKHPGKSSFPVPPVLRGTTCYVTLEPCCHFGKTPPCTDALIQAGVARVVVAVEDPSPHAAGGGIRKLRAAGIRVEAGLLENEARALNAPFFKRVTTARPWVILKWAQSLDGKIATRTGESKWISSIQSRRAAHAVRGRVDAIIVGIGTVLADDPALTCRLAGVRRVATRVVLDSRLRTPVSSRVVRTARRVPALIFATRAASTARRRRLEAAGCQVCVVGATRRGVRPAAVLDEMGRRQMTNVLVEGGGRVLGSFFDAGVADEAIVFVAPKLIGGDAAVGPLAGRGLATVRAAGRVPVVDCRRCGPDRMWRMRWR